MKLKNNLLLILFFSLLSCTGNETITPLPDAMSIQITDIDVYQKTIYLVGTQTESGLSGKWSIESTNETQGSFLTENNSVTSFTGSILETYELRWTIDNGESTIYSQLPVLMASGIPLTQVIQIEPDVHKLLQLYSLVDIATSGITFHQLLDAGITLDEILQHFRISDVYNGGISITELLNLGFTVSTLYDAFIDDNQATTFVQWFINEGISIDDLVQVGATLEELYSHGATNQNLVDASIPFKDLIVTLYFTTLNFLDLNVPLQTLMDEGIVVETPTPGLYIMNYLFEEANYTNDLDWNINRVNQHYATPNAQWFIPTKEQLLYVYENKDQLDLKLELFWIQQRISSSTTPGSCGVPNIPISVNLANGAINSCTFGGEPRTILPMIQL